jgi:hypothetical protein
VSLRSYPINLQHINYDVEIDPLADHVWPRNEQYHKHRKNDPVSRITVPDGGLQFCAERGRAGRRRTPVGGGENWWRLHPDKPGWRQNIGYSYCPDVCPVDLANIMLGLKQAEKKSPALVEKIQPIFISVDPERDTPAVLKQYVSAFHPRLIGLTGTAEEIAAVAKKYLIIYDIRKDEAASEYLVDHSRQAYLFGPDGEPLALLPFDGTPQQVADEIARWVR